MWKFLISPGLWSFNDVSFNSSAEIERARTFVAWDLFTSSSNFRELPGLAWTWIFTLPNIAIAERILFFVQLASPSTITFLIAHQLATQRFHGPRLPLLAGFISSTAVLFNPFTTMRIDNANLVFAIGVSTAAVFLTYGAIESKTFKGVLKRALILGILESLNAPLPQTLVLPYVLVLAVLVFGLITKGMRIPSVRNAIGFVLTVTVSTMGLLSYWIAPYAAGFFSSLGASPNKASFESAIIPSNPLYQSGGLFNAFRLLANWWSSTYFHPGGTSALWVTFTLVVPLLSFVTLIVRPRDRIVQLFAGVAIAGIILASGPRGEFSGLYLLISSISPLVSFLMYDPDIFTIWITSSFSILSGLGAITLISKLGTHRTLHLSVHTIERGIGERPLRLIGCISIIGLSLAAPLASAYPMLTGDLGGFLVPTTVPNEYYALNDWLSHNALGERALWAPTALVDSPVNGWATSWLPSHVASFPGDYLRFVPNMRIFYPQPGTYARPMYSFILDSLRTPQLTAAGKLLQMTGSDLFVYHNDTITPDLQLFTGLRRQSDLSLAASFGPLYAFQSRLNMPYTSSVSNVMIIVGGLDGILPMLDVDSFEPKNSAIMFPDQGFLKMADVESFLHFNSTILFYGNKNFDDLLLDLMNSQRYAPYDYFSTTSSYDWKAGNALDWAGLSPFLDSLWFKHEFDLKSGFVETQKLGASLDIPVSVESATSYQIWARLLLSPKSGVVGVYVDKANIANVNTETQDPEKAGLKWVQVADAYLSPGKHILTIVNNAGYNLINLVTVVPNTAFTEATNALVNLVDRNDVRVVAVPYPDTPPGFTNIFADDFSRTSDWSFNGNWLRDNGNLTAIDNGLNVALLSKHYGTDYEISVEGMINRGSQISIIFRSTNGSGYSFELRGWESTVALSRTENYAAESNIVSVNYPTQDGNWYQLKVVAQGPEIRAYINQREVMDVLNDEFRGDEIGVSSYNGQSVYRNFALDVPTVFAATPWPTERPYEFAVRRSVAGGQQVWVSSNTFPLNMTKSFAPAVSFSNSTQLIVFSNPPKNDTSPSQYFSTTTPMTYDTSKPSTELQLDPTASGQSILIYGEGYDPLFVAYQSQANLAHFPVDSTMNGFIIPSDSREIRINYVPERALEIGQILSLSALFLIGALLSYVAGALGPTWSMVRLASRRLLRN
jgi:hypothetical protein